jgi:serine/threonine-protein kinase RIO1
MSGSEVRTVVLEGGPRNGETETSNVLAPVIGTGKEGGVYQRTDEKRDGLVVYRWQPLSEAEAEAIVRGDLRANQEPE